MERTLASLLPVHLVFFVLAVSPCALSTFVFNNDEVTWLDAQTYCRQYHSDMVTIRNQAEADSLLSFEGWLGLRRDDNDEWRWSSGDELAVFFNWDSGEMQSGEMKDPYGDKKCVWKTELCPGWRREKCDQNYPFVCVETRILVEEKKTWEKALLHCRELSPQVAGSTDSYDLASPTEANTEIMPPTTNEVWVGLRFLAGEWMWMNGQAASNLPLCPARQQHCGAMVRDKTGWQIKDCSEEKSFYCSRKP